MKYLICSDIHGSAEACEKILSFYTDMQCDYLVLLGDILYHGPRNPLPQGHDPKKTASLLNAHAGTIIACRGNCDAEVDQMMLEFPVLADYTFITDQGVRLFCTHGHVYSPVRADGGLAVPGSKEPCVAGCDAVFYGHTHIQVLEKNKAGILVCNPGSVSLPKAESPAGFSVYENGRITLYSMTGEPVAVSGSLLRS